MFATILQYNTNVFNFMNFAEIHLEDPIPAFRNAFSKSRLLEKFLGIIEELREKIKLMIY